MNYIEAIKQAVDTNFVFRYDPNSQDPQVRQIHIHYSRVLITTRKLNNLFDRVETYDPVLEDVRSNDWQCVTMVLPTAHNKHDKTI